MKILIVDDDEIIRGLLKVRLQMLGYTLCTMAENGEEAVKLARATQPDFVFMDISMPGEIDGIAAAQEIRGHMKTRIIFLSAYSEKEILDRAREIRPDGYILKPFTDTDLRVILELRK
jgi:CheY-like chemotaxis protein